MKTTRRSLLVALFGMALLATTPGATAQGFPDHTITIVVPYPTGGSSDTLARALAPKLSAIMGQRIVIENRPGANGNMAGSSVAKSAPDGYTLLLASEPMLTTNPSLFKNLGYEPRDLTPITLCASVILTVTVNPSVPATNMTELIAYLKQNPGTSFGTAGVGTPQHLAELRLARMADLSLKHVVYRGGATIVNDLLNNQIKVAMVDLRSAKPLADSGKLRILAIGEAKRFEGAAQIPTIAETLPGFEMTSWFGFFGPGGMSADIVASLNKSLSAVLQDRELSEKLYAQGIITRSAGPAELAQLVRTQSETFGREVRENKITIE